MPGEGKKMIDDAVKKSETLIEALPYIKEFQRKFVVIKLGGSAQDDADVLRRLFVDIDFLLAVGIRPAVVYGGGKRITQAMANLGKPARFVHGQRVTDAETMEVVSRVLIDEVGGDLLALLAASGGRGALLNGRDHGFLRAIKKRLPEQPDVDLGYVGEPVAIDAAAIYGILEQGKIPLIAPVACGCGAEADRLYNINGDTAAALIARDLHAEKIVFLMDVVGVCRDRRDPSSLISRLTRAEAEALIRGGAAEGGMIPKLEACLFALAGGVRKAHIVPGAQPHALLLEIFTTKGVGTEIVL
ncbi:MAG: acetylglutamate kinase [Planctomycetota bacterium]|nr:acetylglutamate kinase [Planctomycetota bacterium]